MHWARRNVRMVWKLRVRVRSEPMQRWMPDFLSARAPLLQRCLGLGLGGAWAADNSEARTTPRSGSGVDGDLPWRRAAESSASSLRSSTLLRAGTQCYSPSEVNTAASPEDSCWRRGHEGSHSPHWRRKKHPPSSLYPPLHRPRKRQISGPILVQNWGATWNLASEAVTFLIPLPATPSFLVHYPAVVGGQLRKEFIQEPKHVYMCVGTPQRTQVVIVFIDILKYQSSRQSTVEVN